MSEEPVWTGRSSQWKNLGAFVLCGILSPLIVPIFIAIWKWLVVRARIFQLTTERLLITSGVFSRTTDSLELYRVRDLRVTQPFLLRLLGLENIELVTTDETTPVLRIDYMPAALRLGDKLRAQVEVCRVKKRVREVDIE
jgi:uncharacterized membrane protein YdbT with pleckstrin-like domain